MDNYTYYKEEIGELLVNGGAIAVDNTSGKPCDCAGLACDKCLFHYNVTCQNARSIWLNAEHVEKLTLTQDEYKFLSIFKPDACIARDMGGRLFLYNSGDIGKVSSVWTWTDNANIDNSSVLLNYWCSMYTNLTVELSFIKWEDEKPWKVEDLLKLEVK